MLVAYATNNLPAGQYSVVSTYNDASTQTSVTSNTVTYTVEKATPGVNCTPSAPYIFPSQPGAHFLRTAVEHGFG